MPGGHRQSRRQKNFQGERGQQKKDRKIVKKQNNSTINSLARRATEKSSKNSKNRPKKALLNLYYIWNMYENPRGRGARSIDMARDSASMSLT